MPASGKKRYAFQDVVPIAVDVRAANALEFIAYYLDRIDDHLEALAGQAQAGNSSREGIRMELTGIVGLLARLKP